MPDHMDDVETAREQLKRVTAERDEARAERDKALEMAGLRSEDRMNAVVEMYVHKREAERLRKAMEQIRRLASPPPVNASPED